MDNSSLCITSVSERENAEAMCNSVASLGDGNTIEKLSTGLSGELEINDGNGTNDIGYVQRIHVEGYYIEEEDEEDEEDFSEAAFLAQMGYTKSEPERDCEEEDEEERSLSEDSLGQTGHKENDLPKHEPISTSVADLNLVSAFRGSREKEGRPAKGLRVSWAPDVYDPPCTSAGYFAVDKTERHKREHKAKGAKEKSGPKSGVEGSAAARKIKDRKLADKRTKKYGGAASKYSESEY